MLVDKTKKINLKNSILIFRLNSVLGVANIS